ncbi:MAG: hypothetical protein Q7S43_03000 [bacterium]|nr:hypothetical protein [bacterium]MDO8496396.1 hypothetical protein [bacterium]
MSTQLSQVPTLLATDTLIQKPELIEKAAASRGLTVRRYREDREYSETEVIETYKLDKELLEVLGKVGFTFGPGRKSPHDTMIYLAGNSNQRGQEVFESDCWAWKRTETNHELNIYLRLLVSEKERGVIAVPQVWGNCSGGACHRPTINKFVVAIAGYFPDAHKLLKEVTADSYPAIHWSDIGLGGIKSIGTLFRELYGHNESVSRLADSNVSPFSPSPKQAGYNYFVIESNQPKLFEQWKRQLQEYKDRLR